MIEKNYENIKRHQRILILILILLAIAIIFSIYFIEKNKDSNEVGKTLEGVWGDKEKIVEIIGTDNGNVITNDNGEKFYIIFDDNGNFYSIMDEIDKGKYYSSDNYDEVFLDFEKKPGSNCKIIEDKELECSLYANFEKLK